LSEPVKSLSLRLQAALADALLAAYVTFALFCLTLGFRTVDSAGGLTLKARPMLLAIAVDAQRGRTRHNRPGSDPRDVREPACFPQERCLLGRTGRMAQTKCDGMTDHVSPMKKVFHIDATRLYLWIQHRPQHMPQQRRVTEVPGCASTPLQATVILF
jgi:hypothetical protein